MRQMDTLPKLHDVINLVGF